uniref:Putative mucin-5ac n=1 Tax=Anopheles darlingi TaxID=43151 RepID=A0A2M4CS74_ANODA
MTPMQRRFTCGSKLTDCLSEPCTSGYGSAAKRTSTTVKQSNATTRTTPPSMMMMMLMKMTTPTTMKTHRMATVHLCGVLCCCCLLLLLVPLAAGLPITSKPLDNNPDHLTWEAAWLSEDNSRAPALPIGGKTKKITPKSIFITPFLNSYNTSACPPDYKVDYNGKCIQVVSINTADILVTKLQSLFAQHNGDSGSQGGGTGEDDYDYDYDSTGPFQVNLPLSIDLPPEMPPPSVPKLTYQDNLGPSYYDSAMVDVATVDQDKAKITTVSVDAPSEKPFLATTAATGGPVRPAGPSSTVASTSTSATTTGSDRDGAESQPDISFLAFESLPNGTLAGQIELDGNNRTVVQSIFVSSTTPDVAASTDGNGGGSSSTSTTAESTTTELDAEPGTPTDRDGDTADSESTVASSTTMSAGQTDPEDDPSSTVNGVSTTEQTTTEQEEEEASIEELKLELAEESLLLDTNHSSTVSTIEPLTTDVSDMMDTDTVPTSETEPSEQPTAVIGLAAASTAKPIPVTFSPPVRRTSGVSAGSTRPPVQIITPIRGSWDLGYRGGSSIPAKLTPASYVQQDRTTRATPETTTPAFERWTEKPPGGEERNDTMKQEINYQPSTTSVAPSTTTELEGSTSASTSTTGHLPLEIKPIPTVPDNHERYMEQLRKINEIVAEKRRLQQQQEQQLAGATTRIRFPSRTDEEPELSGAASSNSGVRFPGTATNRYTPTGNRLPDIFPKKSATDSTTQRPAFWWLPSGWEVDQAGNKPMLLRFWSRMPLVRDNAAQPSTSNTEPTTNNRWRSTNNYQQQQQHQQQQQQHFGSSNHLPSPVGSSASHPVASARGNSKSPSENFYKEVSAQEVYKVMNARQLNQHQS